MHWTFSAVGPADPDGVGSISMIQLVNGLDQAQLSDEARTLFDTRSAALPDGGCVLYAQPTVIQPNIRSADWDWGDPPQEGLNSSQKRVSINNDFIDYFLYKSHRKNSIWVSLASYKWKFQVVALNSSTKEARFSIQPGYPLNTTLWQYDTTEPTWNRPPNTVGVPDETTCQGDNAQ